MEASLANQIYEITEDSIYELLNEHGELNGLSQTMIYLHFRAYYAILIKLYIKKYNKENLSYEKIFSVYKMKLINYYKINNPSIPKELLDDLIRSFDVSFQLIESIELNDVTNRDELKKFTREVLSSIHAILERRTGQIIASSFLDNEKIFTNVANEISNIIKNL